MNQINISTTKDNKLQMDISTGTTWPTALLMLASSIKFLANKTAEEVHHTAPDLPIEDVKADIADMINFSISNILNELSPKDPDLQLTEVAIATMENQIIHEAAASKRPIADVLKEYEAKLASSPYAAKPFGKNTKEGVTMACGKKSKSSKCGGKKGK